MAVEEVPITVGYELFGENPSDSNPAVPSDTVSTSNQNGNPGFLEAVEAPDNFATSTTGMAVIIVCALVVLIIAGFLFYKGMQRSKSDDEDFYDYEYSEKDKEMLDPERGETLNPSFTTPEQRDAVVMAQNGVSEPRKEHIHIPDHYTGRETNIFGTVVGADSAAPATRDTPKNSDNLQRRRENAAPGAIQHVSSRVSQVTERSQDSLWSRKNPVAATRSIRHQHDNSRVQLDAFEERVLQKNNRPDEDSSLAQMNSLEARVLRKSKQDHSLEQLDAFEARILRKSSDPNNLSRSHTAKKLERGPADRRRSSSLTALKNISRRRLDEFEEKISQKMKSQGDPQPIRSSGSHTSVSAMDTFEERIMAKSSQARSNNGDNGKS